MSKDPTAVASDQAPSRASWIVRLGWRVKRARRRALFLVVRGLVLFPMSLLPLGPARRLGSFLGGVAHALSGKSRERTREHLRIAFQKEKGESFVRITSRDVFRNLGRVGAESLVLDRLGPAWIPRLVSAVEGEQHLELLRGPGPGAIVLTPHFGQFELLAAWFYGQADGVVVERRSRGSAFAEYIRERRARLGIVAVDQSESPRKLLRLLADGKSVGLLPDQDIDRLPGIFVPFFGRDAYTTTAPASLARAAGSPLIPACARWDGTGYRVIIDDPIFVSKTADREADVLAGTLAWSRAIEEIIRRDPAQWAWMHQRWKTTPARLEDKRRRREERRARGAGTLSDLPRREARA